MASRCSVERERRWGRPPFIMCLRCDWLRRNPKSQGLWSPIFWNYLSPVAVNPGADVFFTP
jgi:hypothetical protein